MATVTIDVHDEAVNKLFSRLLKKTSNLRPVFKDIGEVVYNSVIENFRNESDPKGIRWQALAKRTIAARKRKNPGMPIRILHETGALEGSIHIAATNKKVTIGTDDRYYATAMQFGYKPKNIPARPYLGVKDDDWKKIRDMIKDYILK